jgi:hypothetical protein
MSNKATRIFAPISVGELIDKTTILCIKFTQIEESKKASVRQELMELEIPTKKIYADFPITRDLAKDLLDVNRTIWDLENQRADMITNHEPIEDIGRISKKIALLNFDRHAIKANINRITRSEIIEEKSYGVIYED